MHIMHRVKELRLAHNLTLRALATKAKLSPSTIMRIEKGERKISTSQAKSIAKAFGVSVDYLLGKSPEDMLHDFVASIPTFEEDAMDSFGDVTHGYCRDVSPIMRNRFEIIKLLSDTDSADAIEAVYSFLKYFTDTVPSFADTPEAKELLNARIRFAKSIMESFPSLTLEEMETVYQAVKLQVEKQKKEN